MTETEWQQAIQIRDQTIRVLVAELRRALERLSWRGCDTLCPLRPRRRKKARKG